MNKEFVRVGARSSMSVARAHRARQSVMTYLRTAITLFGIMRYAR
jgi:hypothetical protein